MPRKTPGFIRTRISRPLLESLYGSRSLLNQTFVAARVEKELRDKQFTVVHIASHAQFKSRVDETFLLTFDDKLTMDRLNRYIGYFQFREEPLELLTLSACETAAGDDRAGDPRTGGVIVSPEVRFPIIPTVAALENMNPSPSLDNIDFGMVLKLDNPAGEEIARVFVGLNEETEIAGGMSMNLTHVRFPPIDQIAVNTSTPGELLRGLEKGTYKLTYWAQTTDGLKSNKRFEFIKITE